MGISHPSAAQLWAGDDEGLKPRGGATPGGDVASGCGWGRNGLREGLGLP